MTHREDIQRLAWRAHPARQRPAAAALAAVVIAAVAALCGTSGGVWWGLLAAAVLVLSLNRFFFPSRFSFDRRCVTARYLLGSQRCDWSSICRYRHDRYGAYLSTRSRPSILDGYRGMHLLFGTSREEVLDGLRARLAGKGETT